MASGDTGALLLYALQDIGDGNIIFTSANMKFAGYDKDDTSTHNKLITAASNATPIVITSNSHGFTNGDLVLIGGVGGNTNANGLFKVANVATNTFELTHPITGANIAGNGAYTSGGYVFNLTTLRYVGDLNASGIVTRTANLSGKSNTKGVWDATDPVFSTVTGDTFEVIFLFKDTGSDATSPIVAVWVSGTGLPFIPNGGDGNLALDNGANKILAL